MNDEVGYDIKTKPEEKEKPKKKSKEEFLREVAEVAVAAGIDAYRKERQKHIQTVRDRRYNNTKLLLRSYRSLREYNEHTIFDIAQLGNEKGNPELLEAIGLMGESRQVESIRERVAFTRVTMENVEIALEVYKRFCNKSPKPEIQRRWRVLEKMYISEECFTPQEVADLENIFTILSFTFIYFTLYAFWNRKNALLIFSLQKYKYRCNYRQQKSILRAKSRDEEQTSFVPAFPIAAE